MKQVKQSFLKKKAKPELGRYIQVIKPNEVKTLLLVINEESKSAKRLVEELFPSAGVHMIFERPIKVDSTVGFYYSVHPSDFNLTANLKNDKLINLSKMSFDLLLDLSKDSDLLKFFTTISRASFKIGNIKSPKMALYDFLVEYGKNNEESIKQIHSNLITITKND